MITEQDIKNTLPAKFKNLTTQELSDKLNSITTDSEFAERFRENLISYTNILQDSRYSIDDYINAVAFVSYRLMGYNKEESYQRTFPQKYATFKALGKQANEISPYVTAYSKTKLVNQILEQAMIPSWILNQEFYQEAINKNVSLMRTARSEKVQQMAAESLLKYLAKPEKTDMPLINIDLRKDSGLDELKRSIAELAQTQKDLIMKGMPTKEIAEQIIVRDEDDE